MGLILFFPTRDADGDKIGETKEESERTITPTFTTSLPLRHAPAPPAFK